MKTYFVLCPECRGARILPGRVLCYKCGGEGGFVIPDKPLKVPESRALRLTVRLLFGLIIVLLVIAIAVSL